MKHVIKFLLVAICLTGCKAVVKTAYGIKKPRIEDSKSIREYLRKYHMDTVHVYVFKDLKSFAAASEMDFLNIPDATFFNKEGYFIPYKEPGVSCNASVGEFIAAMESMHVLKPDATKKMETLLALLETPQQHIPEADINVFITWTKYAGSLNKDKAFEWVKLLESAKAKGIKANYYLVNCDYQKSWNIPKALYKKLGIKN